MITLTKFATLATATLLALGTAATVNWLCLRAAFILMQPATARRVAVHRTPAGTTAQLVQRFDGYR